MSSGDGMDAGGGTMKGPPPEPADPGGAPRGRPELEAFGVDWLGAWAPYAGDGIAEVARVAQMPPDG